MARLKAYAPLIALVAAGRIFGEQPSTPAPDWPFIRIGPNIATPYAATGWRGSSHRLSTHCFSNGPYSDAISKIARHVVAASDEFSIEGVNIIDMQWTGTLDIPEPTAGKFHYVVEHDITVALSV